MNIPSKLLTLFLLFIFFDPQEIFTFLKPLRPAFFSGLLVFLSIATSMFRNLFKNTQSWLFLVFYLLAINSAYNSIDWDMSKNVIIFLLKCIILYFAITTIINSEAILNKFVWVIIIFSSVNVILTMLLGKLGVYKAGWRLTSYFGGEGSSANGYAMMLLSFLPLMFFLMDSEKSNGRKGFLIISMLAILLGIIRTRSRMGFGGLLLSASMILWDKKNSLKIIMFSLFLVLIVLSTTHERTWERFDTISSEFSEETGVSVGGRMEQWKIAMELIKQHPFFGTGINTFLKAKGDMYFYDSSVDFVHIVHNAYLQVCSEMGIFAAIIFALIILISIKDVWSIERKLKSQEQYLSLYNVAKSLRMGLLSFALCLVFLSELYSRILYILVALSVSVKNIYKDKFV